MIERAVALSRQPVLGLESLAPSVLNPARRAGIQADSAGRRGSRSSWWTTTSEACCSRRCERRGLVKKRAAQLLGISFRSFRYRLEKLGLEDPQPGEE